MTTEAHNSHKYKAVFKFFVILAPITAALGAIATTLESITGVLKLVDYQSPDLPRSLSFIGIALVILAIIAHFCKLWYYSEQLRIWPSIVPYMIVIGIFVLIAAGNPLSPNVDIVKIKEAIQNDTNVKNVPPMPLLKLQKNFEWPILGYSLTATVDHAGELECTSEQGRKTITDALTSRVSPWLKKEGGISFLKVCRGEGPKEPNGPPTSRRPIPPEDPSALSWALLGKKITIPGNDPFYSPKKGVHWPPKFLDLVDLKELEAAFKEIKLRGSELKFCAGNPDGPPPDEQGCVGQTQEELTTVISLVEKVGLIWAKVARVR